ncbi:MAG: hypothetical protein AB1716_05510 [Planctomycetota bacterium]
MLPQSLTTRSVHFAFLFGPPRIVGRQEAAAVYDKLCEQLRLDDFTFKYESAKEGELPHSQGFRIQLERREGRGVFGVTVDNPGIQQPVRLLVQYNWPPSLEHVYERCDLAVAAVFDGLQGQWQKVFAEVRLRAHCGDRARNALGFIRDSMLKIPPAWLDGLGQPLHFASCRFASGTGGPADEPLDNPLRELSIEVLKEDRGALYFELVSQWPQVPNPGLAPPGNEPPPTRQFTLKPSEYIRAEHEFLWRRLQELGDLTHRENGK